MQFYGADDALSASVSSFLAAPMLVGAAAVVVATAAHREAFAAELTSTGVDVAAMRREGRYLELDAAETLSLFMTADGPDPVRFRLALGAVVGAAVTRFGAVTAYGEMVGLLAADGRLEAALELEALWSALMTESSSFRLLCGYPREVFEGHDGPRALSLVHASHEAAMAPATLVSAVIAVPPGPGASAVARRASRELCRSWQLHDREWVSDAVLVVAELVANAVRHASSQLAVSFDAHDDGVTVSVTDGSTAVPLPRWSGPLAENGRGMGIIGVLGHSWGVEQQPLGKRVWVQLRPYPDDRPAFPSVA